MKLGWQLKEEAPLFLLVLIVVTGLMWYMGYPSNLSIGTGFLFAAVITSVEVMIDAAGHKKARKIPAATVKAKKAASKPKRKVKKNTVKKKATKKKTASKKKPKKRTTKRKR